LTFNDESFDTDSIHDPADPTKLICKTAGKYIILGGTSFENNSNGYRQLKISHTRSGVSRDIAKISGNPTSADFALSIMAIYDLQVNDYLQLGVYQNSGGNIYSSEPYFGMAKLS
jgi:hypothetical protein